ncbi:MAG TPA: GTPase [Candidatus Lokiarchaeia archaeon]
MSKKIIIVGPPAVGKTTLRKIFFEGETSKLLLEQVLEPTHGYETLILKLKEDIGIFDLAGQENQRWFETNEKSIFSQTKIIIVVIDVKISIEVNLKFIQNVIETRKKITPKSLIFILIHKIDLITKGQLSKIKLEILDALKKEELINIFFTSITKEYFINTLSCFIEILNACLKEEPITDEFAFDLLNETILLLNQIDNEIVVSKSELKKKLNINEDDLNYIIRNLVKKGQLQLTSGKKEQTISLTERGKNNFNKIINNFSFKDIIQIENKAKIKENIQDLKIPPLIGYFIANKDGLTLMTTEIFDGALLKFIKEKDNPLSESDKFDVALIPMFISALEKFSKEINIQHLSGFNLTGTNLRMQILEFENFTVTIFTNPQINLKIVEKEIHSFFENLFVSYNIEFKISIQNITEKNYNEIQNYSRNWLNQLNKSYDQKTTDINQFDFKSAQKLYENLDDLQKEVSDKFSLILERIRNVKVNIMNALIKGDFEEISDLAKKALELKLNATSIFN